MTLVPKESKRRGEVWAPVVLWELKTNESRRCPSNTRKVREIFIYYLKSEQIKTMDLKGGEKGEPEDDNVIARKATPAWLARPLAMMIFLRQPLKGGNQ